MPIQFYFDADLVGVAKLLVQVRADVTYAGDPGGIGPDKRQRPPSPVAPATPDDIWIPMVAREGWVVFSRDRHIQHRPAEKQAVLNNAARLITLDARSVQLTKWLELEIVVCQWRAIEGIAALSGPWIYTATRSSLRKVL